MSADPADAAPADPEPLAADALMRRLFDLWQEQWAAVSADPTMAEEWARAMATLSWGGGPVSPASLSSGFRNTPLEAMMAASSAFAPTPNAYGFPAAPPGAPTAAPASDDRTDRLDELLARVGELEQRVDALVRSDRDGTPSDPDAGADGSPDRGEPPAAKRPRPRRRS